MHWRAITRFVAIVVMFLGFSMGAPLAVSIVADEPGVWALTLSILFTTTFGFVSFLLTREKDIQPLSPRDGIAIVTLGWLMAGLFGALPYLISGAIPDFTNAYFESISGFTTTGASILNDIEPLPRGILLWRSQTQWFGGMGIIVLSIAILPLLGVGGMQLYKAEVPSPVVDKLKPRISETAKTLWKVYISITALQIALLYFGGLSIFDAVCHAFCTMPTGGFSTKSASIAHFGSGYLDTVFILFMLLAGINFSLHYKLIRGDVKIFGKDPECRIFLGLVAAFILMVTWDIHGSVYPTLKEALRYGAFQVTSIMTTTGFVTADYEQWPAMSQIILLLCMFLGAMAGSTGGAMKTMRILVLAKHSYREIFRIVHPHAVTTVKLGGRPIPQDTLSSIWGFFVLYLGLFVVATMTMAALGLDFVSAMASVAASIGNIGPGLGTVGPVQNYLAVPAAGKWVLIFCMLIGRLEIYTIMVLVTPEYWRK